MTPGILSPLPEPACLRCNTLIFAQAVSYSLLFLPLFSGGCGLEAYKFVNIPQFAILHNEVYLAIISHRCQELINPPHLFGSQSFQLKGIPLTLNIKVIHFSSTPCFCLTGFCRKSGAHSLETAAPSRSSGITSRDSSDRISAEEPVPLSAGF